MTDFNAIMHQITALCRPQLDFRDLGPTFKGGEGTGGSKWGKKGRGMSVFIAELTCQP